MKHRCSGDTVTAQDLDAGGPHQQELVLRLPSLTHGADPIPLLSPRGGGKWLENTQNERIFS